MVELARRSFITGLIAFGVTAPAIVRAGSLMPVKQMIWSSDEIAELLSRRLDSYVGQRDDRLYKRYGSDDEIAELLSRRLDSYVGQRDDRLYKRYGSDDDEPPVTYHAARHEWIDLYQFAADQRASVAQALVNG